MAELSADQLPEGFIIRAKDGRFKVVRGGVFVDVGSQRSPVSPAPMGAPQPAAEKKPVVAPEISDVSVSAQKFQTEHVAPAIPEPLAERPVPLPVTPKKMVPPSLPHVQPAIGLQKTQVSSSPVTPPRSTFSEAAMSPRPPIAQQGGASTYFVEAEDEEDILHHRNKISHFNTPEQVINIDGIIKGIISSNQVQFPDDVMEKRFMQIIRSHLMEMRNEMETEEALTRSEKIGGMGYEPSLARRLMVDIENTAARLREQGILTSLRSSIAKAGPSSAPVYAPKIPFPSPRTAAPARPAPAVETERLEPRVGPARMTDAAQFDEAQHTQQETVTPPPVLQKGKSTVSVVDQSPATRPISVSVHPPTESVQSVQPQSVHGNPEQSPLKMQRPSSLERPVLSDIVKTPQVRKMLGPVDELADLTVTDFRRLGSTVEESKKHVIEKVALLEDESYAMRSAGIKAWRRSPLFQLYMDIGRQSIETGKAVSAVVAERAEAKKETITSDEFGAIADLNRVLQY
ncbi:MAG: hypothetical protein WC289_00905 [Patescibacteria group bacterium]|jgi:hypothetical protein